jgi:glutathione S-transferase
MIDLYYWTTPNGHKITIFLEETSLSYSIKPINIGAGEQFTAEFLALHLIIESPLLSTVNPPTAVRR